MLLRTPRVLTSFASSLRPRALHASPDLSLSSPPPDTSYLSASRASRDGFGFKHKATTYAYNRNTSEYVCTIKLHDVCETATDGTVYTKGVEVVGVGKSKIAANDEATKHAKEVMEDLERKAKVHEQA
ncbi:hypothetical protein JCM11491_000617 [Sporobolomyces phaffii]